MQEKAMPYFTPKQRLKIALGGFMSFIGFIILALAVLVVTNKIDTENVLQHGLLIDIMAIIGVLDVLVGILLLRLR
ncbi:MAG: hypothetical protein QMD23_04460 [Candidatus Bathyarchaeia archaeon]|nr:hypothetical protein [Candidatus Bathyarchaeia archaeon]